MKKLILSVFIFIFGLLRQRTPAVNTLLTKRLPEVPGKQIEAITVDYVPIAADAIDRHHAHVT